MISYNLDFIQYLLTSFDWFLFYNFTYTLSIFFKFQIEIYFTWHKLLDISHTCRIAIMVFSLLYKNIVTISCRVKMTRLPRDVTRAALCGCGYRSDKLALFLSHWSHILYPLPSILGNADLKAAFRNTLLIFILTQPGLLVEHVVNANYSFKW